MVTYTDTLQLTEQADGTNSNTWGQVANLVFVMVDQAINGYLAINAAGSSNITLAWPVGTATANQANNAILKFTGLLTGNIVVFYPVTSRRMLIWNATTGAFTLTVALVGTPGTTVAVPQGAQMELWSDGTNVKSATTPMGPISVIGGIHTDSIVASGAGSIGGNANVGGTLSVVGAGQFDGGLGVGGAGFGTTTATIAGSASVGGAATLGSTMIVAGASTLTGAVTTSGAVSVGGILSIGNTTAASANIGAASAVPSLPSGYVSMPIGGTTYKIPFYAV